MQVTKRLNVILFQIVGSSVLINVQPQLVDENGGAHNVGGFENVNETVENFDAAVGTGGTGSKAILAAVAKLVNAQTVVVSPAVPEVPAIAAVAEMKNDAGEVTIPAAAAVPAIPAKDEVRGPRFDTTTVVFFA